MQRSVIYLIILFSTAVPAGAQQDPLYSLYMFDKLLINPAYAGSSNWMVGTLKYREQARSFSGHPVTQTFNFHGPVQRKHIGLGIKVINDKLPLQTTLNASLFFSYHLTLAGGKLSAGVEAGMLRKSTNFRELVLWRPDDQAIPADAVINTMPDAAAGLYYQKKQFYLGFSATHLLPESLFDETNPIKAPARHLYLLAGNVFTFKRDWSLDPSVLVKYNAAADLQVDVNLLLYYDDKVGVGVQYRNNDAIVALARVEILRGLRLAYGFDYGFASRRSFAHGSHEIILSYGIKLAPPPARKEIHPRYYF